MILMNTNNSQTSKFKVEIIHPEISYEVTGIAFNVHNSIGRYGRERQYADEFEKKLKELNIPYVREFAIGDSGNTVDFLIDNKLILEFKAKRLVTKEDYYQVQRYLQSSGLRLGLIINFRNIYIKPMRVVRIDTDNRARFV